MNPKITITLDPDQQSQVADWSNGETYQVTIEQTAPGEFNLVSVDGTSTGDDESAEPDTAMDDGSKDDQTMGADMPDDTGGTTIPTTKNSAVAALVMSKRAKSK